MAAQEPEVTQEQPTPEVATQENTPVSETPPQVNEPTNSDSDLVRAKAEFDSYKENVDPILQTIMSDPDLYKSVYTKHQQRLGGDPVVEEDEDGPKESKEPKETKETKPSQIEKDNRSALINRTVNEFSEKVGLNSLAPDQRKEMNTKIGSVLMRQMDPTGKSGKTIQQLIDDVSLNVLPQMLEDAYYIATREDRERKIADEAISRHMENESGVVGSMAAGSADPESVTLSSKQREIAKKMNIPEDVYLKNLKEISSRAGQLY